MILVEYTRIRKLEKLIFSVVHWCSKVGCIQIHPTKVNSTYNTVHTSAYGSVVSAHIAEPHTVGSEGLWWCRGTVPAPWRHRTRVRLPVRLPPTFAILHFGDEAGILSIFGRGILLPCFLNRLSTFRVRSILCRQSATTVQNRFRGRAHLRAVTEVEPAQTRRPLVNVSTALCPPGLHRAANRLAIAL